MHSSEDIVHISKINIDIMVSRGEPVTHGPGINDCNREVAALKRCLMYEVLPQSGLELTGCNKEVAALHIQWPLCTGLTVLYYIHYTVRVQLQLSSLEWQDLFSQEWKWPASFRNNKSCEKYEKERVRDLLYLSLIWPVSSSPQIQPIWLHAFHTASVCSTVSSSSDKRYIHSKVKSQLDYINTHTNIHCTHNMQTHTYTYPHTHILVHTQCHVHAS